MNHQDLGYTFPIYQEHLETTKERVRREKKDVQSSYTITSDGIDTGYLGETLFQN